MRWLSLFLVMVAFTVLAAGPVPTPPHRVLLIGVDGMEARVVDSLVAKGELPHLAALMKRGSRGPLKTDYGASSPIVWTTVVTGVEPEVHGISGFAVPTAKGSAPVSSTMRRVPALWTMASASGRTADVFGWWGSWPAEKIRGTVITDRVRHSLDGRVSPASFLPKLEADLSKIDQARATFPVDDHAANEDRVVSWYLAHPPSGTPPALTVAYLHGIDLVSHEYWRFWDTEAFPAHPEQARYGDIVPARYRMVDQALGAAVAAHGPDTNIVVLSDHGFGALESETVKVSVDLDRAFEAVGLLRREGEGLTRSVVMEKTRAYTYGTTLAQMVKFVRMAQAGREPGATLAADQRAAVQEQVATALRRFTYDDRKSPVFEVVKAVPAQVARGADFVVRVRSEGASRPALLDGKPLAGLVTDLKRHSGGHGHEPPGLVIAAGPDIRQGAVFSGADIRDICPTVLGLLGLPVGKDFAGRALEELYTPAFQKAWPIRTVATWGHNEGKPTESSSDDEMSDALRSIGYIE